MSANTQRLAASKIRSQIGPEHIQFHDVVLNAFRHQRSDHEGGKSKTCALAYVLNAFRHQRSDHNPQRDEILRRMECSTPFGIKDPITPR
jgi:hypothetical protein